LDLADPGNKPLSSAKVKRGARMTAARQCNTLCETDHIVAECAPAKAGDAATAAAAIKPTGRDTLDTPLSQA
jgi:hypothetical protein